MKWGTRTAISGSVVFGVTSLYLVWGPASIEDQPNVTMTDVVRSGPVPLKKSAETISSRESQQPATSSTAPAKAEKAKEFHKKYESYLELVDRKVRQKELLESQGGKEQIALASDLLTDRAFAETHFEDTASARIFSVDLLIHHAKDGAVDPLRRTIIDLSVKLKDGVSLHKRSDLDLRDLIIGYIEAVGDDEFLQDLDSNMVSLGFHKSLKKPFLRAVFFHFSDKISRQEYQNYFTKYYQI